MPVILGLEADTWTTIAGRVVPRNIADVWTLLVWCHVHHAEVADRDDTLDLIAAALGEPPTPQSRQRVHQLIVQAAT